MTYTKYKEPPFSLRQLGTTAALNPADGVDPVRNLQSKIFSGAASIEICAFGTGQSNASQAPSFESIQLDQRQAMRELIRVNKVDVSTHSAPTLQLSGFDSRQGFDRGLQQRNLLELKKAIDFAAEAANGGAVVIHAGEFSRSLGGKAPKVWKESESEYSFKEHTHEDAEARYYLANVKTGALAPIGEESFVTSPKYKQVNGKYEYVLDEEKKPVVNEVMKSSLEKDPDLIAEYGKNGKIKFEDLPEYVRSIAYLKKLDYNEKTNEAEVRRENFSAYRERRLAEIRAEEKNLSLEKEKKLFPFLLKDFIRERAGAEVQQSLAQFRENDDQYKKLLSDREEIVKEIQYFKKLKEGMTQEEWDMQKQRVKGRRESGGESMVARTEGVDPVDLLKKELDINQSLIQRQTELVAGFKAKAQEQLDSLNDFQDVSKVGLDRTKETVVEAALYAMAKSEEWKKKRPNDNMKDIQLAIENIFPTMGGQDFGSHPDELIKIIDESRTEMAKRLVQMKKAKNEDDGKKMAANFIGATLDTGHLNVWKKHLVRKPGESDDQHDARFKKWYTTQVEKLAKGNYLANVHLADNFGYDDVHVSPGQGNAPIQEVLEILKKNKYGKKIQAEGGWGPGQTSGLKSLWNESSASIYRGGTDSWVNPQSRAYSVMDGYHTNINKPRFVFGGYSPEAEEWKPWSGTRLE